MDNAAAAKALSALGHEARLSIYRLLVRAGTEGLNVNDVCVRLGLPPSTLSHHLRTLVQAGLIIQEKRGREIVNRPDFDTITATVMFVTEHCCRGVDLPSEAA